jgi:hypothetical protein
VTWFCRTLAAFITLGVLLTVSSVGKEKKPTTGGTAALVVLVQSLYVAGLVAIATGVWR